MINEKELLDKIDETLKNIKEKNALTHCITNSVTINDCANAILAIGGSPFMAEDAKELEEVVTIADVLVINIGKLSKEQINSMNISAEVANKTNTPIVLDPVGVGVTKLRNETTLNLIQNYKMTAIRGNISEIKAIAKLVGVIDENNTAKGVDVNIDDIITKENLSANGEIIKELANKLDLPIVIHTRDAFVDTIDILKQNNVNKKGIFHCCPLNQELIKEAVKLGYYISLSGVITFRNAKNVEEILSLIPEDKLLIETDSPYLSPEPFRGQRNNSVNVKYVAEKIAKLKNKKTEEIAEITNNNAKRIFEI